MAEGGEVQARPGSAENPMSVGYLIKGSSSVLERALGSVHFRGEILSLKRAPSGHLYFSMQSDSAQVSCVMWRGDVARLVTPLKNGMDIVACGRPGIFERDGRFQMYLRSAEEAGQGKDALALAKLKEKLRLEGLFDAKLKKKLPVIPRRVGVVTSKTGAAVRDILETIRRRFPVPVLVADARVQGEGAAKTLAFALKRMALTDVDVIIIGRGGGSESDLSVFNDESVVRAVAACPVPIISAVGHEVDFSLCDLAADMRAATPTMAGEMVVPVRSELKARIRKEESRIRREWTLAARHFRQEVDRLVDTCTQSMATYLGVQNESLKSLELRLERIHPKTQVLRMRSQLQQTYETLQRSIKIQLTRRQQKYLTLVGRLEAMSPLRVLERGYALATTDSGPLLDAERVLVGQLLELRLSRGSLDCRVERVHKKEPA